MELYYNTAMEIFDTIMDPLFLLDRKANMKYINKSCSELLELSLKRIKINNHIGTYLKFFNSNLFSLSSISTTDLQTLKNFSRLESEYETFKNKKGLALISFNKLSLEDELWILQVRDISLELSLQEKYHKKIRELEDANKSLESSNRKLRQKNDSLQETLDGLDKVYTIF